MDPTAQNNNTVGDAQQPQPQPTTPAPTTGSVGYVKKEAEPIPSQEVIQLTEQEPVIEKELAEIGVEKVSSEPNLTLADQKAGLSLAKESNPHPTAPTGAVKLPMTEEEEKKIRGSIGVRYSVRWFAEQVHKLRLKMEKGA